jgi:outer membrane protein assembly factor BamB
MVAGKHAASPQSPYSLKSKNQKLTTENEINIERIPMKTLLKTKIVLVTLLFLAFSLNLAAEETLFDILRRLDAKAPVTSNLLRVKAQTLLDSRDLPALRDYVTDTSQNPDGRVLALELLEEHAPKRSVTLDRRLVEDPVGEMRYNATARILQTADNLLEEKKYEDAAAVYHALLCRAASLEQTAAIVRSLAEIDAEKPLAELGIAFHGAEDAGYLLHWEVSEAYDNPDNQGLDTVYPPENAETGATVWKPLSTDSQEGKLNLAPFMEEKKSVSLYVRTVLESPVPQTVSIRYSTQKTGKVWLNGKEIGHFPLNDDGGDVPDKYVMDAELQPGKNVLLVKNTCFREESGSPSGGPQAAAGGMTGMTGNWSFQVRVCHAGGVPLRVADIGEKPSLPDSVFTAPEERESSMNHAPETGREVSAVSFMQFRGTACNPVFKTLSCSETLFGKGAVWKRPISGEGVSSPIIVKDRILVTSADGPNESRLHTTAYDLATGEKIWRRTLKAAGSLLCYRPFSSVAANTPASDGEHVAVLFSSNDLACFTTDGTLLWYRALGRENPGTVVSVGMAASPLIVGKTLIVQCQSNAESFAEAMEISTGKTLWKIERPKGQGWSSPTPVPQEDGSRLIVFADRTGCAVHTLATGEKLTVHEGKCSLTTSPVCAEGTVYFPSGGMTALKYDAAGKTAEILWSEIKLSAGSPSPVIDGDKFYLIKSPGMLTCADRTLGEILWQTRLAGSFYATPVIIGNHLIAVSQQGIMYNVLLNDGKADVLESIELGENILSTPAVSDHSVLIRSKNALYRFNLL